MWQDALRVCREYIPNKLPLLQEEYDREMATAATKYVHNFVLRLFRQFSFLIFVHIFRFLNLLFYTENCFESFCFTSLLDCHAMYPV